MIRIKILVQAHLQSPAISWRNTHGSNGKADDGGPQAGPSYQRTDLLRRTRTGAICLARRWTKEKGIISSSHPLMPSSAVSLFFMPSFELMPFDFLIVGAQPASVRSSCLVCLLSKRPLVVRARA